MDRAPKSCPPRVSGCSIGVSPAPGPNSNFRLSTKSEIRPVESSSPAPFLFLDQTGHPLLFSQVVFWEVRRPPRPGSPQDHEMVHLPPPLGAPPGGSPPLLIFGPAPPRLAPPRVFPMPGNVLKSAPPRPVASRNRLVFFSSAPTSVIRRAPSFGPARNLPRFRMALREKPESPAVSSPESGGRPPGGSPQENNDRP